MITHKLDIDDLDVWEVTCHPGEEFFMDIGEKTTVDKIANVTIRVAGTADVHSGENFETLLGQHVPGTSSLDWTKEVEGKLRVTVTSDDYKYYCIRDRRFRHLNRRIVRFKASETFELLPGTSIFLAMGTIEVADQTVQAPGHISASNSAIVKAQTDVVMFVYDTAA